MTKQNEQDSTTTPTGPRFTPGPWTMDPEGSVETAIESASGMVVAKVNHPRRWDENQIEANAHLIAAAPDLYEALDSLLDHLYNADITIPSVIMADAVSALARARGEQTGTEGE